MIKAPPIENKPIDSLGEPVWELAYLFPYQGSWSEEDYLALTTNYLIDYSDGYLEVSSMPTPPHQLILAHIYQALLSFLATHGVGKLFFAPVRVRLWPRKYREPDLVFVAGEHLHRIGQKYIDGADLVVEVVSGGAEDRHRDLVTKRDEYAQAGIPEYWIVDPDEQRIIVLHLDGERYTIQGEFGPGEQAASRLLAGFAIDVTAVFASAEK